MKDTAGNTARKTPAEKAAMNPATQKTERPPLTQLRKAVFGGSHKIAPLQRLLFIAAALATATGWTMDIQWTRMAGQWPVEASPLVGRFSGGSKEEILVLNRGGQLLLWEADGTALGTGQDGAVAQLPEGRWTTVPTLVDPPSSARLVVASVEGRVVGLDAKFAVVWQHQLPGETFWGRATPARLRGTFGAGLVFADLSGTVTCLTPDGAVVWSKALGAGPCHAAAQTLALKSGEDAVLVPAGSTLFCCDAAGGVRWRRDLGREISGRPKVFSFAARRLILCATASGALVALSPEGEVVWECATGDAPLNGPVLLPRRDGEPLVLVTGLWGNLHAVDAQGRPVWTHLFRAKTRGIPLVLDADGNGRSEIFVPTFHQHVYEFGEDGRLKDDIRLLGIMQAPLAPIAGPASDRKDLLVGTTSLLAYRLKPGLPKSPYGPTPEPQDVTLHPPATREDCEPPSLLVDNPRGALINVHLSLTDTQGWTRIAGRITGRSAFEVPLPRVAATGEWTFRASARDARGNVLDEKAWTMPPHPQTQPGPLPPNQLRAWATPPFAAFDETRLAPCALEIKPGETNQISVATLYLDEADQGAFIVASTRDETTRARVTRSRLARQDDVAFGGTVVLREVVSTGSVNGEKVPDALPALGDAGLITIPSRRSVKIWLSVDARGAQPGNYTGRVSIASLAVDAEKIELPLHLEVLDLRLPKEFPLTLCTWDYVPNRWFGSRSKEVLDDMSRHGVDVFPRTTLPSARVDAAGKLTIDWTVLDAELDRLQGRGKILFHLNHPAIEFAMKKTDAEKRPFELEYIRALRDHLRERGWNYADYAFYLLDEPGLDYGTNVPVLLEAGKLFREADPKLLTYTDPVLGLSWQDFERIEPLVDVWAPNMRMVYGLLSGDPRMQRIMRAKTVWSYECVSLVKTLSPLRYNRANAWRAKFFGLGGIGFWTHSTTKADPWFANKALDDEYTLVYPGELPVPSVRWEAVRDGLEDVAALAVLEEQIQRHRTAGSRSELVPEAEAALRVALRDIMELSDETFVEIRDFLREGDRVLGHTWTDVQMFRRHRAEVARLTLALAGE